MAKVQDLVDEINNAKIQAEKEGKTYYNTASAKDELAVMKAMMNDTSFKVAIWGPEGITGYYCPAGSSAQTACGTGYYCPTTSQRNQCPAGQRKSHMSFLLKKQLNPSWML